MLPSRQHLHMIPRMPKHKHPRLSDELRRYVRESDMLPIEIARRVGVNRSILSKFLKGERFLHVDTMDAIAELLELQLTKRP